MTSGILMAGAVVGVLYGLFGVGAAFATPALSLVGIPPLAAVVSPLPAFLPSSMAGAYGYARRGKVDWALAGRVAAGALPAAIVGAAASQYVGGDLLLGLKAASLVIIGGRMLRPIRSTAAHQALERRAGRHLVLGAVAVGFLSGLLANAGGFLLVPWFLVVLGLDMHEATGTSLVVAASLTVPIIAVHAFVGDVDWLVATPFAVGLIPGSMAGAWLAQRLPTTRLRVAFGVLLMTIGVYYVVTQLLA